MGIERFQLLLLEDNAVDAALLEGMLVDAGVDADLVVVELLADALDHAAVDLILADLNVPDASGLHVIEQLSRRDEPVIALTGSGTDASGLATVRAGAVDFLSKSGLTATALGRACMFAIERARLDARLGRAELELTAVIEANPEGVLVVDEYGQVCLANAAATLLTGFEVDAVWSPRRGTWDRVKGRQTLTFTAVASQWRGRPATLVRVNDTTGVRAQQRTLALREKQLHQAQALGALGRLSAGLSHEYNNAVMALQAQLQLVEQEHPELRGKLDDMAGSVQRLANITRSVAAFAGSTVRSPGRTGLDTLVRQSIPVLERLCGEEVEVELDLAAGDWRADMPDADVRLVLRNLVENAVDATTRGVIHVQTTAEDGEVCMRVVDSGDGMSEEVFASAREPFFTTRNGRSGLGLSAVHGLVEAASGTLELDSQPGDGTRVCISVPALASRVRVLGEQRGTVLLVEDDPDLRTALAMGLRLAGHVVVEAVDGLHALEKFSADINVLLTDMQMPRMNGDELYVELQKRRPGLPTLFISGHSWNNVPVASHTRFLSKPTSLGALASTVQELLEQEPGRMA